MATDFTDMGRLELLAHSEMCCELYFTLQILEVLGAGGTRTKEQGSLLRLKVRGRESLYIEQLDPGPCPTSVRGTPTFLSALPFSCSPIKWRPSFISQMNGQVRLQAAEGRSHRLKPDGG